MNETLVYITFGVSLVLTGWHIVEEHQGQLWRYFGAIAGVEVPDCVGRLFFTILLALTLVIAAVGILGIDGRFGVVWLCLVGVGFLIGGRVSDWWNSHFGKRLKGYIGDQGFRGNPGLLSSWFYLADAALLIYLLWTFKEVWTSDKLWPIGLVGLLAGVVFFLGVIPVIRRIGHKCFPKSVRPEWEPNRPMPDWATK